MANALFSGALQNLTGMPDPLAPSGLAVGGFLESAVVVAAGQEFFGAIAQNRLFGVVLKIHVVPAYRLNSDILGYQVT